MHQRQHHRTLLHDRSNVCESWQQTRTNSILRPICDRCKHCVDYTAVVATAAVVECNETHSTPVALQSHAGGGILASHEDKPLVIIYFCSAQAGLYSAVHETYLLWCSTTCNNGFAESRLASLSLAPTGSHSLLMEHVMCVKCITISQQCISWLHRWLTRSGAWCVAPASSHQPWEHRRIIHLEGKYQVFLRNMASVAHQRRPCCPSTAAYLYKLWIIETW